MFIEMMTIQKKNHVSWESCSLMLHTDCQRSALFILFTIFIVILFVPLNLFIFNIVTCVLSILFTISGLVCVLPSSIMLLIIFGSQAIKDWFPSDISDTQRCKIALYNLSKTYHRRSNGITLQWSKLLFWSRCPLIDYDEWAQATV